jgi:hypothetical protein
MDRHNEKTMQKAWSVAVIPPKNRGGAFNRSRQHLGQPIGWAVKGQRFSGAIV